MSVLIDKIPAVTKYFGCIFVCYEKNWLAQNLNGFRLSFLSVCLFKLKNKQFGMLGAKSKKIVLMNKRAVDLYAVFRN